MSPDRFQVTLFDPDDASALEGADELYWTLDGLTPADNPTATIESLDTPGRSIAVTVRDDAALTIRFREHTTDGVRTIDGADVLAAHQAIQACLGGAGGWRQILGPAGGTFGVPTPGIDYQRTGLSIATAMVDDAKRRRRHELPTAIPPTIRWGSRAITTGDTWRDIPPAGTITVRFLRRDPIHEHGIAIRAPGGTVGGAQPEAVLWPAGDLSLDYAAPALTLQISNVYILRGPSWQRVERWQGQAAMEIEPMGTMERVYRCNHTATDPPTFADLTVSVRLTAR